MAKTTGLGAQIIVGDAAADEANTITNDVNEFNFSTPRGIQDTTGVDKSAHERLLLLADYSVSMKGVLNTADDMSHDVFSTVPSTSAVRSCSIAPTSNNATPILVVNVYFSDYAITRSNTGELVWDVKGDLADGAVPTWA
jgi:hypothetical protein